MQGVEGVVAPRIAADMQRPELIIEPRLDLAAQLGVTTTALSQAIRIATLGEIDQNAAKFSLSDRQVPIRVVLPKESRQDLSTIENLPVPTSAGGSVPLKRVAEIKLRRRPDADPALQPVAPHFRRRRPRPGRGPGPGDGADPGAAGHAEPARRRVERARSATRSWQQELIYNFIIAVIAGILLVFAVLVLLYRRFVSPLVNMTSLLLAPLGGLLALAFVGLVATARPNRSRSRSTSAC